MEKIFVINKVFKIMKKYKSIIIDDDPIAQKLMEQCVNRNNSFEQPFIVSDVISLKEKLKEEAIDVLFLDVELPELSGIDFMRVSKDLPQVVLMSNMKQYAADAFEVEALEFLPKPVDYNRFLKTVNKLDRNSSSSTIPEQEESIFFKINGKLQKINLSDVLFFEAMSDYVKIITAAKTYVVLHTMTKLQNHLPDSFLRCHRSYLVNLKKVDALDDRVLEVKGHAIPVSRSYYNTIKNRLKVFN